MLGTGWNTGSLMSQPKVLPASPMPKPVRPVRPPLGRRTPPSGMTPPPVSAKPVAVPGPGDVPVAPTPAAAPSPSGPFVGSPGLHAWSPSPTSPTGTNPSWMVPMFGAPAAASPTAGSPATNPAAPPPAAPAIPGAVSGVQTAWDMGAGANRGQVRTNPQTGQQEILMGSGQGGESYSWQPYDPNNYGQKQNADLFARYGSNWTSGSGATSMHSADIAQVLREQLGREPAMNEIYDIYYGANRGQAGIAYNPR